MWTAHAYLHSLHGYSRPLAGAVLSHYDWNYIWAVKNRRKKLPSFRLNVFIQAKRPQYGRVTPKALKNQGLKSPYWRFEITPHQQVALEKLQANLKGKALVCYACPTFHKETLLHKWTVSGKIVENSTFPDVRRLTGHTAWNFSVPGASGVANADPTPSEDVLFMERVRQLIEAEQNEEQSPQEELQVLAIAARSAMERNDADGLQAQFYEGIRYIESLADYILDGDEQAPAVAYGTISLFARLNRLTWLVAGRNG